MPVKPVNLTVVERKTQLLLVEDDDDFRRSLTLRLSKKGYDILPSASAEEAMGVLETREVDAIVADIRLGGSMDGVQLLQMIREKKPDLPVILVTGYASVESAQKAVGLKANAYILKPLEEIDQLIKPIDKAVKEYREHQEHQNLKSEVAQMIDAVDSSEKHYKKLKKKIRDLDET